MLVHDAFSSIGVTLALLVACAGRARWRYVGRTGSLAEYERRAPRAAGAGSWRATSRELPWFARNVAIKVLVLAGRRRWAERIGLDPAAPGPTEPAPARISSAMPATATQWTAIRSIAYSGL